MLNNYINSIFSIPRRSFNYSYHEASTKQPPMDALCETSAPDAKRSQHQPHYHSNRHHQHQQQLHQQQHQLTPQRHTVANPTTVQPFLMNGSTLAAAAAAAPPSATVLYPNTTIARAQYMRQQQMAAENRLLWAALTPHGGTRHYVAAQQQQQLSQQPQQQLPFGMLEEQHYEVMDFGGDGPPAMGQTAVLSAMPLSAGLAGTAAGRVAATHQVTYTELSPKHIKRAGVKVGGDFFVEVNIYFCKFLSSQNVCI